MYHIPWNKMLLYGITLNMRPKLVVETTMVKTASAKKERL
jgi:hypothetical protein